jgi:CRISPR system Cascade subunit CasD
LQSWGADSKFYKRDTLAFPTKSGILGLILCSMGASGAQNELLEKLNSKMMQVVSYVHSKLKENGETFKVDKEPLLQDFHVVGSGFDNKDNWQTLLIPKTCNGTGQVGSGVKLTYRYYLQDARFAVILEISDDMNETVCNAIQNPIYDVYFGRKNCVPTEKIFQGSFDTISDALQKADIIAKDKLLLEDFKVLDGEHDGNEIMTLHDVPIQFGEIKKYSDRRITIIYHE